MKPALIFEHPDGWRIVRLQLPEKMRENEHDDGVRDVIEVTDGKDDLGVQRWKRLDTKTEGVAQYNRVCHGLKRELLLRLESSHGESV